MSASASLENGERTGEESRPKQGLVTQVCREWLIHEDGALAYRLQEKEIEMHYCKNREQRHLIQTDFKQAKTLQSDVLRDIIDNEAERENHDAELALRLQEKIQREESIHNNIREKADKELAKKLQEEENHSKKKRHRDRELESSQMQEALKSDPNSKKNLAVCYEDTLVRATKSMSVEGPLSKDACCSTFTRSGSTSPSNGFSLLADIEKELDVNLVPSLAKNEEQRLLQEVKDQEIALALQREDTNPELAQYYLDQKMAIEAQDHELAILLQEKERHRARKARQKARLQKSKTLEEQSSYRPEEFPEDYKPKPRKISSYFDPHEVQRRRQEAEMAEAGHSSTYSPRVISDVPQLPRRRLERVEPPLQRSPNDELPNVAIMLDPTYRTEMKSPDALPKPTGIFSSTTNGSHITYGVDNDDLSSDDDYSTPDDFAAAPPYMPIQGQKRQTLEKKKKKDNCKQQ